MDGVFKFLQSHFSRIQLFATLWTVAHWPGSSVHGMKTRMGCHASYPPLSQGWRPDFVIVLDLPDEVEESWIRDLGFQSMASWERGWKTRQGYWGKGTFHRLWVWEGGLQSHSTSPAEQSIHCS